MLDLHLYKKWLSVIMPYLARRGKDASAIE